MLVPSAFACLCLFFVPIKRRSGATVEDASHVRNALSQDEASCGWKVAHTVFKIPLETQEIVFPLDRAARFRTRWPPNSISARLSSSALQNLPKKKESHLHSTRRPAFWEGEGKKSAACWAPTSPSCSQTRGTPPILTSAFCAPPILAPVDGPPHFRVSLLPSSRKNVNEMFLCVFLSCGVVFVFIVFHLFWNFCF